MSIGEDVGVVADLVDTADEFLGGDTFDFGVGDPHRVTVPNHDRIGTLASILDDVAALRADASIGTPA